MDLRVSVVLLFIFLTGGYSLKCHVCFPDSRGYCKTKEETCPDYCSSSSTCSASVPGYENITLTIKGCATQCQNAKAEMPDGMKVELRCYKSDLCNAAFVSRAADGVFKGSFLLLFSPLLFYFLFQ